MRVSSWSVGRERDAGARFAVNSAPDNCGETWKSHVEETKQNTGGGCWANGGMGLSKVFEELDGNGHGKGVACRGSR